MFEAIIGGVVSLCAAVVAWAAKKVATVISRVDENAMRLSLHEALCDQRYKGIEQKVVHLKELHVENKLVQDQRHRENIDRFAGIDDKLDTIISKL